MEDIALLSRASEIMTVEKATEGLMDWKALAQSAALVADRPRRAPVDLSAAATGGGTSRISVAEAIRAHRAATEAAGDARRCSTTVAAAVVPSGATTGAATTAKRRQLPPGSMERLPSDCVCVVFSFADFYTRACVAPRLSRRFRSIAQHRSLWSSFDLEALVKASSPLPAARREQFWLRQLAAGRFAVRSLSLRTATALTAPLLAWVLRALPRLELLDLSHCVHATDATITAVAESDCALPAPLSLGPSSSVVELAPQRARGAGENTHAPPSLTQLKLNFCPVTDGGLVLLLEARAGEGVRRTSQTGASGASTALTALPSSPLPSQMPVPLAGRAAPLALSLRHVELSGCDGITCDGLRHVLVSLPLLDTLKCRSSQVSSRSFDNVGTLQALRVLHVASGMCVDDLLVQRVASSCPSLEELSLASCANITDAGVTALCSNIGPRRLRLLYLDACPLLGDASIERVPPAFPGLEVLAIDRTKVGGSAVLGLLTRLRLRELSLSGCLRLRRDAYSCVALRTALSAQMDILPMGTRSFLDVRVLRRGASESVVA